MPGKLVRSPFNPLTGNTIMTQTIYSYQQLEHKSIARLKQIYNDIICTVEVLDKRCKDAWINAIAEYQVSRVQTVVDTTLDEQATAEAIPPQLITVAINFYHHEVYVGKKLIAYMVYDNDEFVMQPWLVMVNGKEIFRATTSAKCLRYIQWHYPDGTLNPFDQIELAEVPVVPTIMKISFYEQEAFVGEQMIARISYDYGNYENLYWRVIINAKEIFRDISPARCHSYIKQMYQQGKLPLQE
ncbi:hypothetical protein [Calothrix sp. NIES-2098]|uniref:hypothetical protein n=1 Tax=Calothrix sp. NIES-2098 TaxID=1954171 RepID=UPI0030D99EBC